MLIDMQSGKFIHRRLVPRKAPADYKADSYRRAREEVGVKLMDMLWQMRLPCVVDIDEHIEPDWAHWDISDHSCELAAPVYDAITYRVRLSPVHQRDVVVPRYHAMPEPYWYGRPPGLRQRLSGFIKWAAWWFFNEQIGSDNE